MRRITIVSLVLTLVVLSCKAPTQQYREQISLAGAWQFALDTADTGIDRQWYLAELADRIDLPGTTDSNRKGFLNRDTSTMHLNRVYKYEGVAWYRKKVIIPESFDNKHIVLSLERSKSSMIWIDDKPVGESMLLQSPQEFDVSSCMTPGEHMISIRVNNDLALTPYGNVHIYTDETQTNWNGIIGDLYLEASSRTYISNLRIFPDIENSKARVELHIDNQLDLTDLEIEILVEKNYRGKTTRLKSLEQQVAYQPIINLEYSLGDELSLWDEYEQPLYRLTAVISQGEDKDAKSVDFGMREFKVEGTQFSINGRTTFLRGKHEAAVFPLTGFPPMDVDEWVRVYRIARSYGINHYRFHSYCPPEAAFIAADREGIYLQAETPFWGGLDSDTLAAMLRAEGYALLKAYGNHPSFVMFSNGNEIWSGHDRAEQNILALEAYDPRPLYTEGSNNGIGYVPPRKCSDFFVGVRTPYNYDTILTHTRLSHGFCDSWKGGILNTQVPSADRDFSYAVSSLDIPIVSHEIGQYQIYPDYREIEKYTGVLQARNLEVFQKRLQDANMGDMDSIFQKATGAWSALCYKAEMEAAIGTPGFAGFQLLDLQDFPGQGTALVGILDAFMDSKEVVSRESWLQSCNDVVVLLKYPEYCLTNTEKFRAGVQVANYSRVSFAGNVDWELKSKEGSIMQKGSFRDVQMDGGGLTTVGAIELDLDAVTRAGQWSIDCRIAGTDYSNTYPLWVYPSIEKVDIPEGIVVAEKLDRKLYQQLQAGAKVLFFPQSEDVRENSLEGHFIPEFWNYGMFKGISEWLEKPVSPGTLGLLMDPEHPALGGFPSDFHTNWQWFSIIEASSSLVLDKTAAGYRPIVQVIDNLERNHKLGLIFEFKAGEGKLLVCMSQLNRIMELPEAAHLYQSLLKYADSRDFDPDYELSYEGLKALF